MQTAWITVLTCIFCCLRVFQCDNQPIVIKHQESDNNVVELAANRGIVVDTVLVTHVPADDSDTEQAAHVDTATADSSLTSSSEELQGDADAKTMHVSESLFNVDDDDDDDGNSGGKQQSSSDQSAADDSSNVHIDTYVEARPDVYKLNHADDSHELVVGQKLDEEQNVDIVANNKSDNVSADKSMNSQTETPVESLNDSDITEHVKPPEEEMPSFDEWKLKEQEKSKSFDELASPAVSSSSAKLKANKKGVNYASVTCGAKILNANSEAQNAVFLLMENKDQYMINPCKAKKFFIVELCEAVQVQAIEVGNLELFSSLPQTFDVYISDRYPTKEWKHLGTFHARDERVVQTFPVQDPAIFSKYLRVEMLTHYGVEHYCPLSILRVFGLSLDEDDEDHELDQSSGDSDDDLGTSNSDSPTNLFSSATDTVLSIVKTVLRPSNDHHSTETSSTVGNMNEGQTGNLSAKNDSKDDSCKNPVRDGYAVTVLDTGDVADRTSAAGVEADSLVRLIESPSATDSRLTSIDESLRHRLSACRACDVDDTTPVTSPLCVYYMFAWVPSDGEELRGRGTFHLPIEHYWSASSDTDRGQQQDGTDHHSTPLTTSAEIQPSTTTRDTASNTTTTNGQALAVDRPSVPNVTTDDRTVIGDVPLLASTVDVVTKNLDPSSLGEDEGSSSSASALRKDIYAESVGQRELLDGDLDVVGVDDITYQKLASRVNKETLYSKLKNRIRTLEGNLNLTNRYLDELSRRYKRQMEEMYASLNQTISKLSNTAKLAAEQDKHQMQRISSLESQVSNLTEVVLSLSLKFETANMQMIERHLVLMACELAMIILFLMYTSRQHVSGASVQRTRSVSLPDTGVNGSVCVDTTSLAASLTDRHSRLTVANWGKQRRLSVGQSAASQWLSQDAHLTKSGSENDVSVIEQNMPVFLTTDVTSTSAPELQKRQRKKKKANQVKFGVGQLQKASSCHIDSSSTILATLPTKNTPAIAEQDSVQTIGSLDSHRLLSSSTVSSNCVNNRKDSLWPRANRQSFPRVEDCTRKLITCASVMHKSRSSLG